MKERKPIFYDSEKVRWRRTRRILEVSGALLTLLLVYFFLTIAGSVELPAALLPDTRPIYHAVKKKLLKPVVQREGRHKRVANIGQVPAKYDPLRAAPDAAGVAGGGDFTAAAGQTAPVDALPEPAGRTSDDGRAEQLRRHGVAGEGKSGGAGGTRGAGAAGVWRCAA